MTFPPHCGHILALLATMLPHDLHFFSLAISLFLLLASFNIHHANYFSRLTISGPSPRAWGKLGGVHFSEFRHRTIPTGVGKTKNGMGLSGSRTDHPHGRGENLCRTLQAFHISGPSPRAWGKHESGYVKPQRLRTIPTGVGKTGFEV